MEAKYPFILITFFLIFLLGLTISSLERSGVINNWDKRRCEIPVMTASMFFKQDSDPRTNTEFAKDNFNFCMKQYIDNFMTLLIAPITALFGKQTNLASSALDMVNTVRKIASTLYNTLSSFLDTYYRKFNASVYEISRIIQFLQMAMRRLNAMVISMIYTGITIFRGMLNTIQFIIKVILIICGILIAIIIILIFVLFPFIPMILSVLGAIVATVMGLVMVMSGDVAQEANNDKGGFCFSENTMITLENNDNIIQVPVHSIKIGDSLGDNCGKITAVIKMVGSEVDLYDINGINVSGSHLVLGTDCVWKSVAEDERSIKITQKSDTLFCFNTTSHNIPVYSNALNKNIIFRDWEELPDDDIVGQYEWLFTILKLLNSGLHYYKWKDGLNNISNEIPVVSKNTKIKTTTGYVEISSLSLRNTIVDSKGNEQSVLGIIEGVVDNTVDNTVNDNTPNTASTWNTELFELNNGVWIKGESTVLPNTGELLKGMNLITETGEFVIWCEYSKTEKVVRDFTDIGYKEIYKTYPLVSTRLRLLTPTTENI